MKLTVEISKLLMAELGRRGGLARAKALTAKQRRAISRKGGVARAARQKKARS